MKDWKLNNLTFSIVRGSAAEEPTDGIAVPVSTNLFPEGPSTGAIFSSADQKFADEVEAIELKQPASITTVDAYGLPSDQVLLCAMNPRESIAEPREFLKSCYENVLATADKNSGINSLGIMPLGLGDHDFSIDKVARSGISKISDNSEELNLDTIKFVVYDSIQYSSFIRFGNEML